MGRRNYIRTPITYYGGKLNMVDILVPKLDMTKKQFVSAFTGGAAVEIAKPKHKVEVWNDIDNRIITFWEVLSDEKLFKELQYRIQRTLHSEEYHKQAQKILKAVDRRWEWKEETYRGYTKVDVAWATWIQTNLSFSNVMFGGFAFANDNSRNGKTMNQREQFTIDFFDRVRNVQLFSRDAIELIKMKDTPETFFFLDPPYLSSDKGGYKGLFSDYKFRQMMDTLLNIEGTFMLTTYYESFLNSYIERGKWNFDVKTFALAVDGKRKETKQKQECIITNYSIQQTLF